MLTYSRARIKKTSLDNSNKAILAFLERHRLVNMEDNTENLLTREFNNLTLENLILLRKGPMSEKMLTRAVLFIQIFNSMCVFFFRYGLFYGIFNI